VDDIILTASDPKLLKQIIHSSSSEFAMTDLGRLHHFLGIKVEHKTYGLFFSQASYASDILAHANMSKSKPCSTPVDTSSKLILLFGV
jgi:hypothetical protein